MHFRLSIAIALAVLVGVVGIFPASDDLLLNGGFEVGDLPTPPGTTLKSGSTAITGWVVGGHGIDYIGTYWKAAEGDRSIDLDSGSVLGVGPYDGSLSQTFKTIKGQKYAVKFDLAGNPDGGPAMKTVRVSAAGKSADFTFLNFTQSRDAMGYESKSFSFVAADSSTTLTFTSLCGTGNGPVIDNVSAVVVPESPR